MKKALKIIGVSLITLSLVGCSGNNIEHAETIAATVNGEIIYKYEIEAAIAEFTEYTVSYDDVLQNSINELVVVQSAADYGIQLAETDLNSFINNYQTHYPHFYQLGVELYGEDTYREGLARRHIFNLVKRHVEENELPKPEITEEDIFAYLKTLNIDTDFLQLSDSDKYALTERIYREQMDEHFYNWMLSQWEDHLIVIYGNGGERNGAT